MRLGVTQCVQNVNAADLGGRSIHERTNQKSTHDFSIIIIIIIIYYMFVLEVHST